MTIYLNHPPVHLEVVNQLSEDVIVGLQYPQMKKQLSLNIPSSFRAHCPSMHTPGIILCCLLLHGNLTHKQRICQHATKPEVTISDALLLDGLDEDALVFLEPCLSDIENKDGILKTDQAKIMEAVFKHFNIKTLANFETVELLRERLTYMFKTLLVRKGSHKVQNSVKYYLFVLIYAGKN